MDCVDWGWVNHSCDGRNRTNDRLRTVEKNLWSTLLRILEKRDPEDEEREILTPDWGI